MPKTQPNVLYWIHKIKTGESFMAPAFFFCANWGSVNRWLPPSRGAKGAGTRSPMGFDDALGVLLQPKFS